MNPKESYQYPSELVSDAAAQSNKRIQVFGELQDYTSSLAIHHHTALSNQDRVAIVHEKAL